MKYKTIPSTTGIYFVTTRVTGHFNVFLSDDIALIPLHSLRWMQEKKIWLLFAYCLMPNHLHILVKLMNNRTIEKVMGQFHSFSGHKVIDKFKSIPGSRILSYMESAGTLKGDRKYLFWEDSLARCIETETELISTMEYIHNNPVNKKWHLVDERSDYRYSSASHYDNRECSLIPIEDCWEYFDEPASSK